MMMVRRKKSMPTGRQAAPKSVLPKKTLPRHQEDFSHKVTEWIGSPASLVLHTAFFVGIFALYLLGVDTDEILLVLTTAVSLEAIYLAIFIQMTVNRNTRSLKEVEQDIDEIQEDVEEISEDVEEISEDVEEISTDIDEIQADEKEEDAVTEKTKASLNKIEGQLQILLKEIENIKKGKSF